MDMLVDGTVVIETKAREPLDPDARGSSLLASRRRISRSASSCILGKKARFFRVFF